MGNHWITLSLVQPCTIYSLWTHTELLSIWLTYGFVFFGRYMCQTSHLSISIVTKETILTIFLYPAYNLTWLPTCTYNMCKLHAHFLFRLLSVSLFGCVHVSWTYGLFPWILWLDLCLKGSLKDKNLACKVAYYQVTCTVCNIIISSFMSAKISAVEGKSRHAFGVLYQEIASWSINALCLFLGTCFYYVDFPVSACTFFWEKKYTLYIASLCKSLIYTIMYIALVTFLWLNYWLYLLKICKTLITILLVSPPLSSHLIMYTKYDMRWSICEAPFWPTDISGCICLKTTYVHVKYKWLSHIDMLYSGANAKKQNVWSVPDVMLNYPIWCCYDELLLHLTSFDDTCHVNEF